MMQPLCASSASSACLANASLCRTATSMPMAKSSARIGDVLSAMAIVVDSQPTTGPSPTPRSPRWRPDRDDSRWRPTDEGFELAADDDPPTAGSADRDRLADLPSRADLAARRPRRPPRGPDSRRSGLQPRRIARVGRRARRHPSPAGSSRLAKASCICGPPTAARQFIVRLDLAGRRGEVREGDRVVARFDFPASLDLRAIAAPSPWHWPIAGCSLWSGRSRSPTFPTTRPKVRARQPTGQPFSIGAIGGPVRVSQWSIARDIYYLPAPGKSDVEPRTLGPTEYWLLGDNSAVSADSRTWPADVHITRDSLVGKILRWR